MVALLRARLRRLAELEGRPYVEEDGPQEDTTGMTLAGVLQFPYRQRRAHADYDSSNGVALVPSAKAIEKA